MQQVLDFRGFGSACNLRSGRDEMRKIAVVEDSKDNRDFLYYLLGDTYEVTRYEDGEQVLAGIAVDAPDLIVMDIRLRGIDGLEVLKRIRQQERLRSIPVLALTANAMTGDREKYLGAGFDEYVAKPIVDIEQFRSIIGRLIPPLHPAA
jgi:CheY-like chemotaxis protein